MHLDISTRRVSTILMWVSITFHFMGPQEQLTLVCTHTDNWVITFLAVMTTQWFVAMGFWVIILCRMVGLMTMD